MGIRCSSIVILATSVESIKTAGRSIGMPTNAHFMLLLEALKVVVMDQESKGTNPSGGEVQTVWMDEKERNLIDEHVAECFGLTALDSNDG